jgi:hypothetical protein
MHLHHDCDVAIMASTRPPRRPTKSPPAVSRITTHTLETDGVVSGLYAAIIRMQLYASKRVLSAEAMRSERGRSMKLALPVPDTVVFERDFPQGWYTYDRRAGQLQRLPGRMLDAATIVENFNATSTGAGGICAQFVSLQSNGEASPAVPASVASVSVPVPEPPRSPKLTNTFGSFRSMGSLTPRNKGATQQGASEPTTLHASGELLHQPSIAPQAAGDLSVVFLTPADLENLVFGRGKYRGFRKDGLLQAFVPPRAAHNDLIEVVWSPKATTVRRAVNLCKMATRTVNDIRVKSATLDGPPHLSMITPVNSLLQSRLLEAARSLAVGLLVPEHKVLSRMVLHCKQDRDGELWLLYATSIRVADEPGAPTIRRPRFPLRLTSGSNFTTDMRRCLGTDDAALDAAEAKRVDLGDTPKYDPKRPPPSVIAYDVTREDERRRYAFRILAEQDRSPSILATSLLACDPATKVELDMQLAPRQHAADAREQLHQYFENLVYELHDARSQPAAFKTGSRPRAFVVPQRLRAALADPAVRRRLFQEALGLDPDLAADPDGFIFRDSVERDVMAAAQNPSVEGKQAPMLRSADARRVQHTAPSYVALMDTVHEVLQGL